MFRSMQSFTWFGLQLAELVMLLSASSCYAVVFQQGEDFFCPSLRGVCVCHPCNKGLRNRFLQNAGDCSCVKHVLAECTDRCEAVAVGLRSEAGATGLRFEVR